MRPLIVISLEGLSTAALGCYGSTWNATPAIDSIASTGVVWDRWIAEVDDPVALLRHALTPTSDGPTNHGWCRRWRDSGSVELFTDAPQLNSEATCFDRTEVIASLQPDPDTVPSDDLVETQLGRLFASAIERDAEGTPWSVLWLHSDYLVRCWDAPRELFAIDSDVDDSWGRSEDPGGDLGEDPLTEPIAPMPPLFDSVIPPHLKIEPDSHPDLAIAWMRTYGCQICLLDMLLEVLLSSLSGEDYQLVIVGASSFRLGQHGLIGHRLGPLRSPDVRLPLIVSDAGPLRVPQLTPSRNLANVLRDLGSTENPLVGAQQWRRPVKGDDRIATRSDRALQAITTPQWFFVEDLDASEHLFLKPDDIEDFNDVARIRPDIVSDLSSQ